MSQILRKLGAPMRALLLPLALLAFAGLSFGGVQEGDYFRTLDGGWVQITDISGGIHGDYHGRYEETQKDGDVLESGKVGATPTLGGCAGEVDEMDKSTTHDDETGEWGGEFDIVNGNMRQKNAKGDMQTLSKRKPPKDAPPDDGDPCADEATKKEDEILGPGDTIGSLPV